MGKNPFGWHRVSPTVPALVILLSLGLGCSTWKPRPVPPTESNLSGARQIRVTLIDGGIASISGPRILQDSLLAGVFEVHRKSPTLASKPGQIPISLVEKVEVRGVSATRTFVFAGSVAAFAVLVALTSCWDCPN